MLLMLFYLILGIYLSGLILTFFVVMCIHLYETYYEKVYCHKSISLSFSSVIILVYSLMWPIILKDEFKKWRLKK